jgi:hypothetical protein
MVRAGSLSGSDPYVRAQLLRIRSADCTVTEQPLQHPQYLTELQAPPPSFRCHTRA